MKRLLSVVLVILMGCFARLARADEASTCDVCEVRVLTCNDSICKGIDVVCFFKLFGNETMSRCTITSAWSPSDHNFDGSLELICGRVRGEGGGYKNYDSGFKNFLASIIAHRAHDDEVYAISPYSDSNLFRQLVEFLLRVI